LAKQFHSKIAELEDAKYDLEYNVRQKDFEVTKIDLDYIFETLKYVFRSTSWPSRWTTFVENCEWNLSVYNDNNKKLIIIFQRQTHPEKGVQIRQQVLNFVVNWKFSKFVFQNYVVNRFAKLQKKPEQTINFREGLRQVKTDKFGLEQLKSGKDVRNFCGVSPQNVCFHCFFHLIFRRRRLRSRFLRQMSVGLLRFNFSLYFVQRSFISLFFHVCNIDCRNSR